MTKPRGEILFLTLYPATAASPRYRVHQFLPYLQAHGFKCTVASAIGDADYAALTGPGRNVRPFWYHAKETPRRIGQILGAGKYDVVVVQKAIMSAYVRGLHALLRGRAKRIVYDIDDAVHLAPPHPLRGVWRGLEDRTQIVSIMRDADVVLAGNQWLCDEAQRVARRVEIFPTVVDTSRFTPAREPVNEMRVGWIGGPSTTPHLTAAQALDTVDGIALRCIGADKARVPWRRAEVLPWDYETEVQALQDLAVGVMPLEKSEWTRGKCALKALQYMACGTPCVATPFGAVADIIAHGVNGLFADSDAEWIAAIEMLRDPVLRARIGAAGRETVVSRSALEVAAPRFAEILESIL